MRTQIFQGDITTCNTDAIVNAANPTLLGGGGVDGAIHRAAGPELRRACMRIPFQEPEARCPVGWAVVTPGFNLPARYVIHTVGPIYPRGRDPKFAGEKVYTAEEADKMLHRSVQNCLKVADKNHIRSVTFPAISCGFYGCFPATFGRIAKGVLEAYTGAVVQQVDFVLYNEAEFGQFMAGWEGEQEPEIDIGEILCEMSRSR
jgi:O-acetyl-ADP-ribose deacetylase (regulator of RNase III)